MPSKYAHLVDNYPILQEEPTYQAKVDAKKREIAEEIGDAFTSSSLALLYKEARQQRDITEEQLYQDNLELTAISQMLVDRYEIDGITGTTLEAGDKVSIQYEPYAVVEDREKVWEWCRANGYEREMQLNWQTLNAVMKDRLLKGEPEPDGVRAFTRVKPVYRKA